MLISNKNHYQKQSTQQLFWRELNAIWPTLLAGVLQRLRRLNFVFQANQQTASSVFIPFWLLEVSKKMKIESARV